MTLRPFVCGCCHAADREIVLATRRRRDRTPASAHGRHAPGAAPRETAAAPGVRGYSPPPPPVSPIRGLIDFHTHAAPDVFGRALDDDELASQAAARQMEAVVFKNHVALTADRAWLARKHVPGVKVFGVVWFPTFDADHHVRHAGTAPSGVRVVDERGAVLPAVREVFKVCATQRLVIHTGHSSAEQALALIAAAREEGCDRIVVTHAQFDVVGMNEAQMKEAFVLRRMACKCSWPRSRPRASVASSSRPWAPRFRAPC